MFCWELYFPQKLLLSTKLPNNGSCREAFVSRQENQKQNQAKRLCSPISAERVARKRKNILVQQRNTSWFSFHLMQFYFFVLFPPALCYPRETKLKFSFFKKMSWIEAVETNFCMLLTFFFLGKYFQRYHFPNCKFYLLHVPCPVRSEVKLSFLIPSEEEDCGSWSRLCCTSRRVLLSKYRWKKNPESAMYILKNDMLGLNSFVNKGRCCEELFDCSIARHMQNTSDEITKDII